jgi:hypothetical protein
MDIDLRPHENPRIDAFTPTECLQWVLEFIQRDLDRLAPEEIEALGHDLRHATVFQELHKRPCTGIPAAQVRELQQEIRQGVHTVLADSVSMNDLTTISRGDKLPGGWTIPLSSAHVRRVRSGNSFRILCVGDHTDDRDAIRVGVVTLLSIFGDRLRTCEVCGTPFLRRYRQEYCGVRCSNKVRNRRRLDRQADQRKRQRRGTPSLPDTAALTTA